MYIYFFNSTGSKDTPIAMKTRAQSFKPFLARRNQGWDRVGTT